MILEQLSLARFRGFEQIDLTFDPRVTVIAGVNGVGKSGILHALTVLFSRSLPEFTPSTAKPVYFTDDDIYHGKPTLETSAVFTVADQRCHINIQRVRDDEDEGDQPLLLLENVHTEFSRTGELDAARTETQRVLRSLQGSAVAARGGLFLASTTASGKTKDDPQTRSIRHQGSLPVCVRRPGRDAT